MAPTPQQVADVCRHVDKNKLVELAVDLTSIPSPTGEERQIAEFLYERYREIGLKASLQEIEPERYNALGLLRGDGTGPRLMLNGHMDTSYSGREPGLPELGSYAPKGYVKDGWIYGLGIYNMKSALACYVAAAEAIQKAGVRLKGDLLLAAVAGEIEMGPVDAFQGRRYRGGGAGSVYLVRHGGAADCCVIGEPTDLRMVTDQMGFAYTKITVYGTPAHSAYVERAVSAIKKMVSVIEAIEEWAPTYKKAHSLNGVEAGVNMAAIQGGLPYRGSRTPYYCTLYVDCRLLPAQKPIEVQHELEGLMARLKRTDRDLRYEVELYASNGGTHTDEDEYACRALRGAHRQILGSEVETLTTRWYSDAVHLTRYGIPTINYGPAGATVTGVRDWDPAVGEQQDIEKMYACAKVYVALILDVCMQERGAVLRGS